MPRKSRLPAARLALPFLVTALQIPGMAHAAQSAHRCITLDGESVYTDRYCEDIGAMDPLPELPTGPRISVDQDDTATPFSGGCPRRPEELIGAVETALRAQNANRLSTLYDWSGTSHAASAALFRRLEQLSAMSVLDVIPYFAPASPPADSNAAPASLTRLQIAVDTGTGKTEAVEFRVGRRFDCLWITF